MMNLDFSVGSVQQVNQINTEALIIPIPDNAQRQYALKSISVDVYAHMEAALQDGDFKTSAGYCLLLRRLPELKAPRLLLVGAGGASPKEMGKAIASAVQELKKRGVAKAVLCLECVSSVDAQMVERMVLAAADAAYEYRLTKSVKEKKRALTSLQFIGADLAVLKQGVSQGAAMAEGVFWAKEWGNRPANHATPTMLAQAAQKLAKSSAKISTQVMGPKEVEKLGMGALMAVAQGSAQPLRFIVMKYQGAAASAAPVVLVGKGITFDAGGISLKPAAGMDEMKFDMCGAASVLGVFAALAQLKPKLNVVGLIASCENLPDGKAVKPGDVVTSMSGQTIEILNTDAEGRLILCDALTFAERLQPQAVVDIATLTGACVVALGKVNSGLFSNNEHLQNELYSAGVQAGDPCWPLPMDDDYADALKSNFADVANVGGRDGGAITAAMFLKRFAAAYDWAHLDIAGTAWKSGAQKGATGRPVPLLIHFLLNRSAQAVQPEVKPRAKRAKSRSGKTSGRV
ncbi:Cytosol aminopeptidase [Saezia sanguinis]|uniref:Probable cytosol aminopeptidase n=2 Tax=Saezia sanguinis TaxID=1965230 RepID=A0A433SG03_9BURK|nr:leucyl aminopeptidase [Saezia sanguinis]RUS67668.1 Cytosol aminopeptidase [Saezia sanguinis]